VRRSFQAGYELGHDEAQGQLATIAESFVKSLEELSAFRARLRERYEQELLELALGVARKVVQGELAARPEIWLGMIRSAVHRAVDREHIVLRVPPPLLVFLRDRLPELRASLEAVKELELVEDPGLPPGGCVVESRFGEVDIGVDPQLEAVERALLGTEE
jgi:flagellar assembly protein FliH